MNATLVTAFYDTGRENWDSLNKPYSRKTSTYVERFMRLTLLENEVIVFAEKSFISTLKKIVGSRSNITFVEYDIYKELEGRLNVIREIQKSHKFIDRINLSVKHSPEYWNEQYVLVTNAKPLFLLKALDYTESKYLAWIDFGYCRSYTSVPKSEQWCPPDNNKVTLMFLKNFHSNTSVEKCIFNNDVYISGGLIIAHRSKINTFYNICQRVIEDLASDDIVDDDQGVLLGGYVAHPDFFEKQFVPDWQENFKADIFKSLILTNGDVFGRYGKIKAFIMDVRVKVLVSIYKFFNKV